MYRLVILSLAVGVVALFASGCMSAHGILWCPPLDWIGHRPLGDRLDFEGADGSSPETAIAVPRTNNDRLVPDELYWVFHRYWLPLVTGRPPLGQPWLEHDRSFQEYRSNAKHETRRIKRRVYDIVTVRLQNGETRTTYFDVTSLRFNWPRER